MAGHDVDALRDHRVGRLGFLDGQRPVAGEDHLGGGLRVHRPCPQGEGVDVAQHLGDRLGSDEAKLAALGGHAGDDAGEILRLVDVAEVAAGVHRVLGLVPQAAAVTELDLRILRRHAQHVRVEVAERGREQERGAVEVDHALHRFLDGDRLGHLLFLDDLHAGHLLQDGRALGMGLVVAVVVARADIDEAHDQRLLRHCAACQTEGRRARGAADKCPPADIELVDHRTSPLLARASRPVGETASGVPCLGGAKSRQIRKEEALCPPQLYAISSPCILFGHD